MPAAVGVLHMFLVATSDGRRFTDILSSHRDDIQLPVQFVGVQVDVTSKTEGTAVGDKSGVPLLVKYDTRLRESGKNAVNEINSTVQVGAPLQHTVVPCRFQFSCCSAHMLSCKCSSPSNISSQHIWSIMGGV